MRIAFVVNDINTEKPGYTTTHLALAASRRGHEVWYISVGDFCYDLDEHVHARATRVSKSSHRLVRTYLQDLCSCDAINEYIDICELDVIMLRNDPAEDFIHRPWARLAGTNFAHFAAANGVIVVNDPEGLRGAVNKLYLQLFPAEVRPKAVICRDARRIKTFCEEMGGTIVIKPLYGSGGRNVFLLRPEDGPNINQIIETVSRDGYVIAQEYIEEATRGDTRLFMLNGRPLEHRGVYAALRRVRQDGDMRSNMTAGATSAPAVVTDAMLALADTIGPLLLQHGMFFVGLDLVDDKILEINVFSPGGLESAQNFTGVKFSEVIIQNLEERLTLHH